MPTIVNLHPYQSQAFYSEALITIMSAGIQSGKTTLGATWAGVKAFNMANTMNHIIVAPTYKILQQATLPKFLFLYRAYGHYNKADSFFKWHHGPITYIRSMTDPNSIEGITDVGSVWVDELGLLSRYAWENVMGRAAFKQAQIMGTTTPYALNWLFHLWKEYKAKKRDDVNFITFRSIDNPHFPKPEYERQRAILDPVRFRMKYEGIFGQMEGLVYPNIRTTPSIHLPEGTKYYAGVDWGYTNPFALVIRAVTPDGMHYRVGEFYKTQLTIEEMVRVAKARQSIYNIELFICDPAEPKSIASFNRAGLKALGGDNSIRAGIDAHTKLIKENRFEIFEDLCPNGIDEYSSYHYPSEKELSIDQDAKEFLPVKQHDHGMDADRMLTMFLDRNRFSKKHAIHMERNYTKMPEDPEKRLEWLKAGGKNRVLIRD